MTANAERTAMPGLTEKAVLHMVLGLVTPAQAAEVRRLWLTECGLAPAEAERRLAELLFLIRRPATGELMGVSTAYPDLLPGGDARYWFFRMFIREPCRGEVGLPALVLRSAFRELASQQGVKETCRGLAAVVENPKFRGPRMLAIARRAIPGSRLGGHDRFGTPILCWDFPDSAVCPPAS